MKRFKKTWALLLAVMLLLTACGGSESSGDAGSSEPEGTAQESEGAEESAGEEAAAEAPSGEPIKFGMVTEFPKEYSNYVRNSVAMAVEEINAAGGVLGRPIEVVVEDEGTDQQGSVNAMMKLLSDDDIVAVLGSIQTPYCLAASEMVLENKIPTLMGGSSRSIVEQGNDYLWLVRTLDKYCAENVVRMAVDEYGCEKIAIMHFNDASGLSYRDTMTQVLKDRYGMEPAITLQYNEATETNFDSYIIQVMEAGADFLFCTGGTGSFSLIKQAVYNNGFEGKCMGSSASVELQQIELVGAEACEGWSSVSDYTTMGLTNEFQLAFVDNYTERMGFAPSFHAAEYYDMVYLFKEAIELSGAADRESINEGLKKIENFQGAMSHYSYHEDHGLNNMSYIVTITDGAQALGGTILNYE